MVIDAHAHIFPKVQGLIAAGQTRGLGYGRVTVGNEEIQIMPPLSEKTIHTPEMLLSHMRWAGVDKAVLLQGPFYGECNQYVRDAVEAYPDCLIGLAYLDPGTQMLTKSSNSLPQRNPSRVSSWSVPKLPVCLEFTVEPGWMTPISLGFGANLSAAIWSWLLI